jgi:hypothetical protein
MTMRYDPHARYWAALRRAAEELMDPAWRERYGEDAWKAALAVIGEPPPPRARTVAEIYQAAEDLEVDPERVAANERAGKRIAAILREREAAARSRAAPPDE